VDDGIARAIQIGESNARIIELAQNWCAHLEVEKNGGTGLVEMQTGLPIGMRSFKCVHASAAGFAGMALEGIALDFYDRNCVGCNKRSTVRLPNLSQLVAERDDAKKMDEARHEAAVREERTRYEMRNRARLSVRTPMNRPAPLLKALMLSIMSLLRKRLKSWLSLQPWHLNAFTLAFSRPSFSLLKRVPPTLYSTLL